MSYKVEWISNPFGFKTLIMREINSQVELTSKTALEWYPARVRDWYLKKKDESRQS